MASHDAETVIGKVAHALKTEVDQDRPIISGELPLGGHRFEGILPPAAPAPAPVVQPQGLFARLAAWWLGLFGPGGGKPR